METVIDGLKYNTETATLVAHDRYWDGSNHERQGRNKYLYKTKKGNYFLHTVTLWQGERDDIMPLEQYEAQYYYERELPEHNLEWEEVFGKATEA